MAMKKAALGKGLGALLNTPPGLSVPLQPPATVAAGTQQTGGEGGEDVALLPVDRLEKGRYQPRVDMRSDSLQELADSIQAQGVIQPILVRPLDSSGAAPRYEIIAGERRWRAAQLAGLKEIPAIVRSVPDKAAVAMALIENIQRENLNPLEEARALQRLIGEFEMTHQQAAEAVGRSRVAVSNLLRLLELNEDVRQLVDARELEMGHARALLGLSNGKQQAEVARLVAKKGLSVRDTEALVRKMTGSRVREDSMAETAVLPAQSAMDPDVRKLQEDLTDRLGAKVTVQHNRGGKGKLVILYNSLDELDGILGHLGHRQ